MKSSTIVAPVALLAASAMAQSPAGFTPSSKFPLGVEFGKNVVYPNGSILQTTADAGAPSVYSAGLFLEKYMVLMVDLSIPSSLIFDASVLPTLVPGLEANRTTRVHWWQGNVTHNALTGFFETDNGNAIAPYEGPEPPAGDIAHAYSFWLFPQPAHYEPSAAALAGYYDSTSNYDRFNFSLPALAAQVGQPLAANYMRTQNSANLATTTTTTSATTSATNIASAVASLINKITH